MKKERKNTEKLTSSEGPEGSENGLDRYPI